MKTLIATLLLSACLFAAEKAPNSPKPESQAKVSITLGELVTAQPSLLKLFSADLPVKAAWGLRTTQTAIETALKHFEEQRQALVKKYSDGKSSVLPEKMEAFSADYRILTEIQVEIPIAPISLALFGDQIKFSISDMARLEKFLVP